MSREMIDAVPGPIGVRGTRWRADPFARGSYSFLASVLSLMTDERWQRPEKAGFSCG